MRAAQIARIPSPNVSCSRPSIEINAFYSGLFSRCTDTLMPSTGFSVGTKPTARVAAETRLQHVAS